MNSDDRLTSALSFKEIYNKARHSPAWEELQTDIFRLWTDDGDSWAFPFFRFTVVHYSVQNQRLFLKWDYGAVAVAGPRVLAFYDDFCNHRATSLRADGKDILSVTILQEASRSTNEGDWR